jgi:hypothetical protein
LRASNGRISFDAKADIQIGLSAVLGAVQVEVCGVETVVVIDRELFEAQAEERGKKSRKAGDVARSAFSNSVAAISVVLSLFGTAVRTPLPAMPSGLACHVYQVCLPDVKQSRCVLCADEPQDGTVMMEIVAGAKAMAS